MAGGNYPAGTGPTDPRAPWNQPEPPECPECLARIRDPDDHEPDCESKADAETLVEDALAEAAFGVGGER